MKNAFFPQKRELILLETTDSTNNYLKQKIRTTDSPLFLAVCALSQTAGRGRLGKSFFSPQGGLYASVSFPLTGSEENIPFLTLLAGLAVSNTLDELCLIQTKIKWPNDIYLHNKKLCGILTELLTTENGLTAVVGIGVNLTLCPADLSFDLQNKVTSLLAEGALVPEKEVLLRRIISGLDQWVYRENALSAPSERILKQLNQKSFLTGKAVTLYQNGSAVFGTAQKIARNGALIIKTEQGNIFEARCGEVTPRFFD